MAMIFYKTIIQVNLIIAVLYGATWQRPTVINYRKYRIERVER